MSICADLSVRKTKALCWDGAAMPISQREAKYKAKQPVIVPYGSSALVLLRRDVFDQAECVVLG